MAESYVRIIVSPDKRGIITVITDVFIGGRGGRGTVGRIKAAKQQLAVSFIDERRDTATTSHQLE
jgi:hypothetical protein